MLPGWTTNLKLSLSLHFKTCTWHCSLYDFLSVMGWTKRHSPTHSFPLTEIWFHQQLLLTWTPYEWWKNIEIIISGHAFLREYMCHCVWNNLIASAVIRRIRLLPVLVLCNVWWWHQSRKRDCVCTYYLLLPVGVIWLWLVGWDDDFFFSSPAMWGWFGVKGRLV